MNDLSAQNQSGDADSASNQKQNTASGPQIKTVETNNLKALFTSSAPDATSFVNTIIYEAVDLAASDIFIESGKRDVRVRFRIDSVLYEVGRVSLNSIDQITSRIKILSNLDPIEKRRIQEGQFAIDHDGRLINLRVEVAQTVYGELIVIRIHEKKTIVMNLTELGFSKVAYDNYMKMLQQRSGLILVCGPTGCGKTTTLYSTISKLNENQAYNVMTVEDPVEYQMDGVNQMQTQSETGFTFAQGLKTILRLSPDIVLVGEIRDQETAKIAVESGLTGQLVFSTIHADDSVGTMLRLLDLGIESYFINSALLGVVAQRLVRRICQSCKQAYKPTPEEQNLFKSELGRVPEKLFLGTGCYSCKNLGYWGRMGIYEVLCMDMTIKNLIREQVSEEEFRHTLSDAKFETLLRSGLQLCEQGLTTMEEVVRNSLRAF